jgi:hypothetical protein
MVATPGQRNRLMQQLRAETCVHERTESQNERNGRSESIEGERFSGDAVPRPLGSIAMMPIPANELDAGAQPSLNPSLVLAPESTLRLLPSRTLSFAPAACSVSVLVVWCNGGMRKGIDFRSAFRHTSYRARLQRTSYLDAERRSSCSPTFWPTCVRQVN